MEVHLWGSMINQVSYWNQSLTAILTSKYSSRPNLVNSYWRWTLKFMSSTEWTTILINCIEATWNKIANRLEEVQTYFLSVIIGITFNFTNLSSFTNLLFLYFTGSLKIFYNKKNLQFLKMQKPFIAQGAHFDAAQWPGKVGWRLKKGAYVYI